MLRPRRRLRPWGAAVEPSLCTSPPPKKRYRRTARRTRLAWTGRSSWNRRIGPSAQLRARVPASPSRWTGRPLRRWGCAAPLQRSRCAPQARLGRGLAPKRSTRRAADARGAEGGRRARARSREATGEPYPTTPRFFEEGKGPPKEAGRGGGRRSCFSSVQERALRGAVGFHARGHGEAARPPERGRRAKKKRRKEGRQVNSKGGRFCAPCGRLCVFAAVKWYDMGRNPPNHRLTRTSGHRRSGAHSAPRRRGVEVTRGAVSFLPPSLAPTVRGGYREGGRESEREITKREKERKREREGDIQMGQTEDEQEENRDGGGPHEARAHQRCERKPTAQGTKCSVRGGEQMRVKARPLKQQIVCPCGLLNSGEVAGPYALRRGRLTPALIG
ncbi:unnamed protein product [Prorocentrum cordatum]|uniref:Uncharacterized protein n=1 Tax=Prorocentrum cordatum TaxID=2364126 RepID=A0ABN9SAW5_9DINO|nr:unnamed protein product [Polarella glacialis]